MDENLNEEDVLQENNENTDDSSKPIKVKVGADTVLRTVVLVIALVNQVLTATGHNPLPFSNEELYSVLSAVFTVIASIIAWWKNNSFTKSAIYSDGIMKSLKDATKKGEIEWKK